MQQHRQALPPGTRLHEYELLDVLGSGGFGVVYLAHDHGLEQRVVIKEYLPSGCAVRIAGNTVVATTVKDEEVFQWGLERFLNEARALAEFRQHPNIVSVLRHFHANNTGYMVMEYAGDFSLQEYLERHGTLAEAQLQAVIFPLLDALEKIHAKGMIHRDLKPGNVLINAQEQPVLIDFGSARQALEHKSQSLTAIVTHGYSPFEQYTKTGNQGAWTDIYALSAVMYRCVTGKIPPDALERMTPEAKPLHTAADTSGDYSPSLLAAIDWGLQVRLEDRPQLIAAWRDELLRESRVAPPEPSDPPRPIGAFQHWLNGVRPLVVSHNRWLFVPVLSVALLMGVSLLFHKPSTDARVVVTAEAKPLPPPPPAAIALPTPSAPPPQPEHLLTESPAEVLPPVITPTPIQVKPEPKEPSNVKLDSKEPQKVKPEPTESHKKKPPKSARKPKRSPPVVKPRIQRPRTYVKPDSRNCLFTAC